jgi:hypothetical protein
MSYCRKRFFEPTRSMILSAWRDVLRKKPGMSSVLIGSISSLIPASSRFFAAKLRL